VTIFEDKNNGKSLEELIATFAHNGRESRARLEGTAYWESRSDSAQESS
jgi:hypothetical protein